MNLQSEKNSLHRQKSISALVEMLFWFTNIRMPYGSRKFDLPQLMADMTITIHASFPDLKISFNEGLMLAMVQYGDVLSPVSA